MHRDLCQGRGRGAEAVGRQRRASNEGNQLALYIDSACRVYDETSSGRAEGCSLAVRWRMFHAILCNFVISADQPDLDRFVKICSGHSEVCVCFRWLGRAKRD